MIAAWFVGTFGHCSKCRRCCAGDTGPEYFIPLFPNELRDAAAEGFATEHLSLVAPARAVCRIADPTACGTSLAYKPIECRFFPAWPSSEGLRGEKCGIPADSFSSHMARCREAVLRMKDEFLEVQDFIDSIDMGGGYRCVNRADRLPREST